MKKVRIGLLLVVCAVGLGGTTLFVGCGGSACSPCTIGTALTVGQFARALLNNLPADGAGRIAISCWDLNGNGVADAEEDVNADGTVDALDCQGAPGEAGQSIPGSDGLACWDLDGDGVQDAEEDVNGDGQWTALDCRGPAGPPGGSGSQGPPGSPGPQLFDMFINDFFIADDYYDDDDYYDEFSPGFGYFYAIPTGLPFIGEEDMTAFLAPVPQYYNPGYPVTLRLFLSGSFYDGCAVLQLDVFRGIPGVGIEPYGQRRWIKIEQPVFPVYVAAENGNGFGSYIVIDLPLQAGAPDGLALPDDLESRQMLGFIISGFELDGTIVLGGAELFESLPGQGGAVDGATIYYEEDFGDGWPETICYLCEVESEDPDVIRERGGCPWVCDEDTDCPYGGDGTYCAPLSDNPEISACFYSESQPS